VWESEKEEKEEWEEDEGVGDASEEHERFGAVAASLYEVCHCQ
jgi:hypothetical protein